MTKQVRQTLVSLSIPVLAIILALIIGGFFVAVANTDPTQSTDPLSAYQRLFCEGFGSDGCNSFKDLLFVDIEQEDGSTQTYFAPTYGVNGHSLALVIERATPLILTALAATVAFQAGMFSIGMDGQLVLGAIVAVFLGYAIPGQIYPLFGAAEYDEAPEALRLVMHVVMPLVCMAGAMAIGAFWSWIVGYLKVRLNVNELISTIILNAIAVQLVGYLVNYPLRADMNNIARTFPIDDSAWLIPFYRGALPDVEWFSGARVGVGFLIALLATGAIWFFLWRTTAGYEQRMTRGSPLFARFGGIPSEKAAIRAMLISGALSGLAGALMIIGVERRVVDGFAQSGVGFDGVLVAILAKESVPGILLAAAFFAGLDVGAVNLQFGNLPRQLGGIIFALIVLFSSMETFFRSIFARLRPARQVQPAQTGATT